MSASGGGRGDRRSKKRSGGGGGGRGGGGGEGGERGGSDSVIAEVMSENDIDYRDIPRAKTCSHFDPDNLESIRGSKRYFLVKGFAWYRQHAGCTRTWASAHSWCVIDLKQQKIIHKYGQDCKTCGGKSTPSFDEEARRRMAEYVCKKYLYRTGRLQRQEQSQPDMADLSGEREGPHDQSRCDMCKVLGRSCQSRTTQTKVPSDTHSGSQSYSSSPASSQRSPTGFDMQAPPELWCTSCGSSNHSYWDCTYQGYEEDSSSGSDETDHYTTSQPQWTPRSYHTASRPHTLTPVPRSGTKGSADRTQTDPMSPRLMLHCTYCGSTDHTYWSCPSRTQEQERKSNTRQGERTSRTRREQFAGSSTRPRNDNRGEVIGLVGLAAAGAIAAAVGLGALLLGRR